MTRTGEERWLESWRAVERLEPWIARANRRAAPGGVPVLRGEFAELEQQARSALAAHGLLGGAYAAAVTAGVASADPGNHAGGVPGAATHGLTTVFAGVASEVRPLDLGLGWAAGVGLQAGRQPVLAMVRGDTGAEPMFKNATVVATELRFAKDSRTLELSAVSRAGATRIDLSPVRREEDSVTRTYIAAANDRDEWALFFDARFEARWYGREVWATRLNMRTLDPLLRASVGIRHDERFHRTGDLQPFNDPTGRVFFGFAFHPVRAGRVGAGGAFEFEGALRGANRLPSGYRLAAEGTLDLRPVRKVTP